MYHISDIKKYLRCERLYHYSKLDNDTFKPYLRNDENLIDLFKDLFDIDDCFIGVRNDENNHFFDEKNNYEWFYTPRFVLNELRLNVPLVHKINDEYDLYYVYYGNIIKEIDLITFSITIDVLAKLGLIVNNIYIIYTNEDYVNDGKLNAKELFKITDRFNKKKIIDIASDRFVDYQDIINKMNNYVIDDQKVSKSKYCRQNGLCKYYDNCFPDEKKLDVDSILSLVSSQNKQEMYDQGIMHLKEVDIDKIEGTRVQYAQIMASKNNGLFVDNVALNAWLKKLENRPISFIDFEWDRYFIPKYINMKPMDVICFEFALYYLDENGQLNHKTFVSTGDCRKQFIEALIEYLPSSGPIVAYNAKGAECLRIQELINIFPEYEKPLNDILNRFVDLAQPFTEGLIYDTRMEGNYSLKKLVDICSEYSYADLDIDDGLEAVFKWRSIDKNIAEEPEDIIRDLEQYCSLDAYGLFLVYKWLVNVLIESKNKKGGIDL